MNDDRVIPSLTPTASKASAGFSSGSSGAPITSSPGVEPVTPGSAMNPGDTFISPHDEIAISLPDESLQEIAIRLIVLAFIVAAIMSAVFIFVGGVSFILSGGNDEKIKKAVNTIRYSIVGLIVTILSGVFVTVVGRFFGINLEEFIPTISEIQGYISQTVSGKNKNPLGPPTR